MELYKNFIKNKKKIFSSINKELHEHPIIKFISVIALILIYFLFALKLYGLKDGILVSALSWSFFVLSTPIADAGILIDLPIRLITGIKMIYSEIVVWIVAISLNVFAFIKNPEIYDKTILLVLFKKILENPFPFWIIIFLSLLGTFLSIYLGDIFIHKNKSKNNKKGLRKFLIKYRLLLFGVLILLIIIIYNFLLNKLDVSIPII